MSVIKITVNDQDLVCTEKPVIASQGVQEDQVEFTFSEQWDNLGKVAVFFNVADKDQVYTAIIDADGKAVVPWEVTQEDGAFYIGAYGTSDDVIYTSNLLRYTLEKGIYTVGQESEPPTPDLIRQLLATMGNIDGSIQDLRVEDAMLNERIDQIVAGSTSGGSVVLFGGDDMATVAKHTNTTYTLAQAAENFDYIDIYINVNSDKRITTIEAPKPLGSGETAQVWGATGYRIQTYSPIGIQCAEFLVSFEGTTMTILIQAEFVETSAGVISYNMITDAASEIINNTYIYKVVGRTEASAAELTDIRVGVDGTVYDTAGTAVRTQFTNENIVLSTVANSIENITGNKPIIDWQRGYISLPASGGTADLTTHTNLTDYISTVVPCQAGDVFGAVIHGGPSYARWRAYLDADNKVLARGDASYNFNGTFTVPTNPAGIAKMVINTKIAAGDMFLYKVSQTPNALTGSLLMPPGGSDGTE